ncbi:TBC1 domain family member 20 [Exaiptasia diaphana]|nr:TBC1 domain family member 20 [Exaiptasia diaphana]
MRVLCKNPNLHYYQGYHDIAVTLLLVVGEDLGTALLEKISLHQLRDYMDATMEKTTKMLSFMHPIIKEADPELEKFLLRSEVGQMFALSWSITWYGHVLKDFDTIVRLYDFFLATHPLMPVYLAAALVIERREEILLGECEMSFVHHLLSRIPENFPYRVEEYIVSAIFLFDKYSPEKLASAADKYLKESMSVKKHSKFLQDLDHQRPDSVLRERRVRRAKGFETLPGTIPNAQPPNPYVKLAVWTLTASLGTVALYVLSSAKRWI